MASVFNASIIFWFDLTNWSQSDPSLNTDVVSDVTLPWCPGWCGEVAGYWGWGKSGIPK